MFDEYLIWELFVHSGNKMMFRKSKEMPLISRYVEHDLHRFESI